MHAKSFLSLNKERKCEEMKLVCLFFLIYCLPPYLIKRINQVVFLIYFFVFIV